MLMAGAALLGLVASGEVRGRILAIYYTLANAAAVPAMVLGVTLMSWLGARGVFVAAGTLGIMATAVAGYVLRNMLAARESLGLPDRAITASPAMGQVRA
jgi:uncharacterized membrane protein (DUF441 family)